MGGSADLPDLLAFDFALYNGHLAHTDLQATHERRINKALHLSTDPSVKESTLGLKPGISISMSSKSLPIVVCTDGACSGNPGPGGYGAVIAYPTGKVKELGASFRSTTNNQMELMGVIAALKHLKEEKDAVHIYTDSTYVIRGITMWIWAWKKRGWKNAEGKDVANPDLWKQLSALVAAREIKPEWKYVRGHTGSPGNERCDEIATSFTKGKWVDLYDGPLLQYPIAIYDLPENTELPEMKPKAEKKAAYSYLSVVNGIPERHADWKHCEARVKGRSGAKFKKAETASQEAEILGEWGFSPDQVSDDERK